MGNEVIDGYDGYSDNASRSFLFGYGIPFTQTGLKTSYSFNSKVSASLMLVQGADVVKDNNSSKSVGAQLTFNPSKSVAFIANYMGGAERKDNNHDLRHTFELISTWKPREKLALALDTFYGTDANAVGPGHNGDWVALASYLRYDFTDRWAIAMRGEVFNDKGGVRTGTQQELTSFGLTPSIMVASAWDTSSPLMSFAAICDSITPIETSFNTSPNTKSGRSRPALT